jgi:hypothetical protein
VTFDWGPAGSKAEDCFFGIMALDQGYSFNFIQVDIKAAQYLHSTGNQCCAFVFGKIWSQVQVLASESGSESSLGFFDGEKLKEEKLF